MKPKLDIPKKVGQKGTPVEKVQKNQKTRSTPKMGKRK
jgi:hypothetical protein